MSPPIVVEVLRGGFVENRHEVDVAVVGADGHRSGWGRPTRPVLARSALKPIQAFPLIATGASSAFELSQEDLALACASHAGAPLHVDRLSRWLASIGCEVGDLECGSHRPIDSAAAKDLLARGASPDARHNSCSGKHCGFLTVSRHLGLGTAGYCHADHPVQSQHVTKAIEAACEISLSGQVPAIDGCGSPVWEFPLDRLALGWSTIGSTDEGRLLFESMLARPELVAGSGQLTSEVIVAARGQTVVKNGAEGVYTGCHVGSGLAWALKVRDGAQRAADAALLWLLDDLGLGVDLEPPKVRNWAGVGVGSVRVSV